MEVREGLIDREAGDRPNDGLRRAVAFAALFLAAAAVQAYLVRPFDGPAAPDAAASVLYFQRIVAGRHLETFVNTTPKPLLTFVYGVLYTLTHDWQLISLATVLAAASAAVLGAELARRVGGVAAGVFAFVALAGLGSLLREASWAYGLPWAVALWFAAALALVRARPRYRLAGVLLLVAALARTETFLLLGLATLAIIWGWRRDRPAARAALPLLIGWLAIVGMGIHDWLLIGDPLWWTTVAATHAAQVPGQRTSVGGVLRDALDRAVALGPTTVLAVVGTALLFRRRSWVVLLGLVALGPLVVVEDLFFAWRGLDVLGHYFDPLDIAAVVAASVAVGAGADAAIAALRRRGPGIRRLAQGRAAGVAAIVAAAVLAAAITPFAPLSSGARAGIGRQANLGLNEKRVRPVLACALGVPKVAEVCTVAPASAGAQLFPSSIQLMTVVVDLGIPVTRATAPDVRRLREGPGYPPPNSIVYLDDEADLAALEQATGWLRVTAPAAVQGVHVVPLLADPGRGLWVVRVDP